MKTPFYIIFFRYLIVLTFLYFIWIGNMTSIKIFLTLIVFHSECLYVANRFKEAQMRILNRRSTAQSVK